MFITLKAVNLGRSGRRVYIQVRFLSVAPVKALRIRLTVHRIQDCLHLIPSEQKRSGRGGL
jgi:hypothetical protein